MFSGLLRIFFKLLYHEVAWTYDLVAWTVSSGLWRRWILTTLPYLQGPRILELGPGTGHLQVALHKEGLRPVGLDESRQMARIACGRMMSVGVTGLMVNGYAQYLPFPNEHFDQVVATFPSEYIVDPATLQEVCRVLKPGGELVTLPLAWLTGQGLRFRFLAWLFRTTHQAPEWDVRMVEPFEKAGFSVQVEFLSDENSRVAVILAEKPV